MNPAHSGRTLDEILGPVSDETRETIGVLAELLGNAPTAAA